MVRPGPSKWETVADQIRQIDGGKFSQAAKNFQPIPPARPQMQNQAQLPSNQQAIIAALGAAPNLAQTMAPKAPNSVQSFRANLNHSATNSYDSQEKKKGSAKRKPATSPVSLPRLITTTSSSGMMG